MAEQVQSGVYKTNVCQHGVDRRRICYECRNDAALFPFGSPRPFATPVHHMELDPKNDVSKYADCPHGARRTPWCSQCDAMADAKKHTEQKLAAMSAKLDDAAVNHPSHYTKHPSGVECITVTEHMNFNVGNAIKYLWRAGSKNNLIEDLKKARWYVDREILRQSTAQN